MTGTAATRQRHRSERYHRGNDWRSERSKRDHRRWTAGSDGRRGKERRRGDRHRGPLREQGPSIAPRPWKREAPPVVHQPTRITPLGEVPPATHSEPNGLPNRATAAGVASTPPSPTQRSERRRTPTWRAERRVLRASACRNLDPKAAAPVAVRPSATKPQPGPTSTPSPTPCSASSAGCHPTEPHHQRAPARARQSPTCRAVGRGSGWPHRAPARAPTCRAAPSCPEAHVFTAPHPPGNAKA